MYELEILWVYSPYLYFHHSGREIRDGDSGPDCGNTHCIQNPAQLCCFKAVPFVCWPWAFVSPKTWRGARSAFVMQEAKLWKCCDSLPWSMFKPRHVPECTWHQRWCFPPAARCTMCIGRAGLSLWGWFTDLPDVNGGKASSDPLLRNSQRILILESLSCSILLELPCRKYPRGRHRSSGRINQLPRTRTWCLHWVTKQLRCLEGQELQVCRSSIQLSEHCEEENGPCYSSSLLPDLPYRAALTGAAWLWFGSPCWSPQKK